MSRAEPDPDVAPPSTATGSIWLRPGVFLAIAVGVAMVGATGEARVPPGFGFLLGATAVSGITVILLVTRARSRGAAWTWAAVLAGGMAGGAAGHVLLAPGMPRVHDLMHPWGIWAYGRAVGEGHLWPRWIPYLGCGIPLLQFYGPLNFLLALPAVLLGLPPVTAFKSVLLFGHVVSPVAGFAGARLLGAGRSGALVAAVALAFAPWRLANFDYRGALGEATAFVFLPLAAAATLALWKRVSVKPAIVLVLAVAGLVLTHLLSVFTLFVALVPALITQSIVGRGGSETRAPGSRWTGPRAVVLMWIVALGLTAAWWIPAVGEIGATSVEATTRDNRYYHYDEHGLSARDLAERRGWDQLRGSIPRTARADGLEGTQMPFYIGAVLVLMAWSGAWWSRERSAWALAVGSIVAVALSTAVLATLAASLPLFATVRFPWRFLTPATVLAALALGVGVDGWLRRYNAAGTTRAVTQHRVACALGPMVIVVALIWDGAPYAGAADRIPAYQGIVHWHAQRQGWTHWEESMRPSPVDDIAGEPNEVVRVRDLALPPSEYDTAIDLFYPGYYEWLSPEVYRLYWRSKDAAALASAGVGYGFSEARARPSIQNVRSYATLEGTAVATENVTRQPGRIEVRFDPARTGGQLIVLEQAFPGWRARIDGGPWVAPETRQGFLSLEVSPGAQLVEMVYGYGTPQRRAGLAISGVTALLLLAAPLRRRFL